jgi:hypothetical protein
MNIGSSLCAVAASAANADDQRLSGAKHAQRSRGGQAAKPEAR